MSEKPVTFPPGRARLLTTPGSHRIAAHCHHDWHSRGALSGGQNRGPGHYDNDFDLEVDEFLGQAFELATLAFCPAIFKREISAFDIAKHAQPVAQALEPRVGWIAGMQNADTPEYTALLCANRQRDG